MESQINNNNKIESVDARSNHAILSDDEIGIDSESESCIVNVSGKINEPESTRVAFVDKIKLANAAIRSSDYATAIKLYTEAISLDPENHVLYGNRSAVLARLGKYQRALADAIKARELKPTWCKSYYRQGVALQAMGRHPDALAAFASGLAQDSKNSQLLTGFVEAALKSPLRATLEPLYRQLHAINLSRSPFVITSCVGQELLAKHHYDAAAVVLEASLQIGTTSNKLRGSVYSALSSAYWALNDLEKAIYYMEQDLQVARSLGDALGECRAHANLGSAYFAQGNYKEALAAHRYQLVWAMKAKLTDQAAAALNALGHVYSALKDFPNALSSHKQALQLIRSIQNPTQQQVLAEAREVGDVGSVYLCMGDLQKCTEYHLEHVKLAKNLGNKLEEARAYSNLGSAHQMRRKYEQAARFHEHVLRLSQELADRSIESKACAGLGHAARGLGEYVQAKRWFQRQLDLALMTRDPVNEGRALSNLGTVYVHLGDTEGALKLHYAHLSVAQKCGDIAGVGKAYGSIGQMYAHIKNHREAIKFYQKELLVAKEMNDKTAEALTYGSMATSFQALDMHDTALQFHEKQLELAEELKDLDMEAKACRNIGICHTQVKMHEKAITFFERFQQLSQSLGDIESEARACHLVGNAYFRIGHTEKAIEFYEKDLELAKSIQERHLLGRAYCNLTIAYAAMGQLQKALECHKYFMATAPPSCIKKFRALGSFQDVMLRLEAHRKMSPGAHDDSRVSPNDPSSISMIYAQELHEDDNETCENDYDIGTRDRRLYGQEGAVLGAEGGSTSLPQDAENLVQELKNLTCQSDDEESKTSLYGGRVSSHYQDYRPGIMKKPRQIMDDNAFSASSFLQEVQNQSQNQPHHPLQIASNRDGAQMS